MKRFAAISLLALLFGSAFVSGQNPQQACEFPDSLRSVYLYTEGIKLLHIAGDTARARESFAEAIGRDSAYAPAYYELASNGLYDTPDEAVALARRAYRLDTTNRWYHRFLGQTLILADRYREALEVYRDLQTKDPAEPDHYRLLAALYEQTGDPYMALATLDSAELRFGRIPLLSAMKRQLLVRTHQTDKAIDEARALVAEAPYEAQHHTALGELYGIAGEDSLALVEFTRALEIEPADMQTLMSLSDFHSSKQNYRELLGISKRLFELDEMPLDAKIRRFEQFTSDIRFYRRYYPQLDDLASTLAIRYPDDPRVTELYAGHLIASGETERALDLYKLHLGDEPPVESFHQAVIEIESYLKRPDSVMRYIALAKERFPRNASFNLAEGNALLRAGKYRNAIVAYNRSLRYADTDSLRGSIWGIIGDAWHLEAEAIRTMAEDSLTPPRMRTRYLRGARSDMRLCFEAYRNSLRFWPDNPMVLNNYAYFLTIDPASERSDFERAFEMSSRAVKLTDNNPTYLDTYAWALYKLERYAEAKRAIQQAVAFDRQESPELLGHYGDILDALGERFPAEVYWRKALEKGYDAAAIERRLERRDTPQK